MSQTGTARPVRALVLLSSLATGGSERNVVAMLPHLGRYEIDAALCTLNRRRDGPLADEFDRTGLPRHDLGATRLLDPRAWLGLHHLIRYGGYDLVHCEDQYANILGGGVGRLTGTGVVMTRHVVTENTHDARSAAKARLDLAVARLTAHRVITLSEDLRGRYARDAKIESARVVTIYNGLDLTRWRRRRTRAEARDLLGWSPDVPVVSMVAVLRQGKGHEVLFAAVPKIIASVGSRVSFKVVGSGALEHQLRRDATGCGDALDFLGERDDVPTILDATDVLVLPSWSEALPTVLMEAGAVGTPVVATEVGGVPEIVVDGETGYLVGAGDSDALARRVCELLTDPARARQMGRQAEARIAARFSIDHQAAATAALYRTVLRERAGPSRERPPT